jgi:hypothetical protein
MTRELIMKYSSPFRLSKGFSGCEGWAFAVCGIRMKLSGIED